MKLKPAFDKLLEEYVFSVAAKFMDLMDSKGQTKLIEFISRVDTWVMPTESAVTLQAAESSVIEVASLSEDPYTTQLETQWQEALKQPAESEPVAQPISPVQYLLISLQASIDLTIFRIGKVDQLVERAELNQFDRANTARLLAHYQSLKKRYIDYLTKLKTLQEKELLRLSRLGS